jgi:REP element-mobilizing transposase RayT
MPQTLSFNLVHIIFSTKHRVPLIKDDVVSSLHAYLAGTARSLGCDCFRVGGVVDHVHLALKLPVTRTAAKTVSEIKTSSSAWMKEQGVAKFAWQRGYGLFSVSPADIGALVRYIDEQGAHHRKGGFQDEMRAFFEKYHIAFDERYVWD